MSGIADFFNEYFKPLGDLSHLVDDENSYTSRLVEHDEATSGGTGFSGPKQHAIANNERRVKKMTNRNRMSPTYTQQQGIDPKWVDFIQKDEENWKKWLQDNLPRRQVDASMANDPMLAEAPGTRALYDAIAEETPAQRAAINTPASLPKTNVSLLDLDYTGAMGIPEYTPEYVNQAVSDVESGRYSPERIIRDVAWTGVSIPATALQMGLNTVNPLVGGALDDFINQYNKGLDATKQYIASPQLIESGNEIAQQIQNQDFAGTLAAMAENPGWVFSEALRNTASMAIPTGIAGVLGKVAQAAKATQFARFAPSAERAAQIGSQIGNVAMNLGSTFSDSDLQDLPLAQRYLAGAISGAGTATIGALTDGGAEGLIAKRLFNQEAAPAAERGILPLLKNAIKEGVQEYGEGMSDYTGQQVAKGQPIDLKVGTIQNLPDVVMGALTGGATHIGTNLGRIQPLQTQQTTPQTDEALIQSVLDAVAQQPPRQPQVQAAPVETPTPIEKPVQKQTAPLETSNEQSVQAEPIQKAPVIQEAPQVQEQKTAPISIEQNPSFDLIKDNGGLSQQALSDLGFEAQDAKSLPQGIVADKNGLSVQDAQALLREADIDDDIETLIDYAVRQTTGIQPTTDDTADWKAWVDKQIQEPEEPTRSLQRPIHQEALTRNDTQNRDRSSKQSIIQMNSIASNPDYGRLGVTNDFGNGSPVVYGDNTHVLKGKSGTMIASDGRRIPFTYGVVDAKYLIPSNLADGTPVAEYDTGAVGKLRAIAGNGRTAGLKEAYRRKTANTYRSELLSDTEHGVPQNAIKNIESPILVRVMNESNVTSDLADVSNTATNATLTPLEQAKNDARRIDISALEFDENGVSEKNIRDFVKSLPLSEQTGLLAKNGAPTRQAKDRLMAAVFATAYNSDGLADLYIQSADNDVSRNILNALGAVAHKFAKMENYGAFDIRPMIVRAAEDAINARKNGKNLAEYVKTKDFTREPEADIILRMFATNVRSNKRITEALNNLADGMIKAYESQDSMFGDSPTREQVFNHWKDTNYGTEQTDEIDNDSESRSNLQQQSRTEYASQNDAGQVQSERTQRNLETTARPEPEEQGQSTSKEEQLNDEPNPLFSQYTSGRSTVEQIKNSLERDKANNAAVVVQSINDIPSHLKEQIEQEDRTIEGLFDPKTQKVYLIADNLTPERAINVARHEVIGHYGIEAMLGKDAMDQTVQRVLDGIANNNKLLNELVKDVDTRQPGLDESTLAKEVIAIMAERNLQNGIARRILNAIRKFLHKLGLIKSDVTDADIAKMLRDARQYVLENDGEMIGTGKAQYSKGPLNDPVPDNPMDGINDALSSTAHNSVHPYYFVADEAVEEAKKHGLDITGFKHTIDGSSIKHTNNHHGVGNKEASRNQIAIRDDDYRRIPEIVTKPDIVVYGTQNGQHHQQIAYIKAFDDGVILYIEEYRQQRKTLNTQSMRKYPPATRASSIVKTLGLNVQNDKGYADNVVENPKERKRENVLFSQNRGVFDIPEVTYADNIIRAMQDRMIDIKRIQKAIEETGGVIRERENVYGKEELYTARVDARIKKFDEQWVTPLLKDIKETGMSIAEVGDWLYARHVVLDKVNQRLAEINPDHPEKHKLSGLTDQEARKIYQEGVQNEILQRVGKRIDTLTRRNVQQRVLNGLMTQEEAKQWLTYDHYVPMNRDNSGTGISPKGRGMEVKGKESKRRMGSTTRASDILANLFANSINLIQRIEKARVGRSLLDLARNHPNEAFWKVDIPKTVKRLNPQTGLVERVRRDENLMPANNVLVVKENGVEHWIAFNKNNERAMRIAQAMKQLDGDQAKFFTNTIGRITRYMGQWMTSKNPAFMFSNFFRDVQDAVFNLSSTPISGKEAELIRHIPSAMKAIWQMERGTGNQDNEMLRFAKEFREAGGETAFLGFRGTIKEQSEALEKRLRELTDGKPAIKQIIGAVGGVIANANDAVENSVRLATYVTARNEGLSRDKAASIAKNITVNFNRRGSSTSIINSLYLFANANIQGHTRMLQAMVTSRKAQIIGAALIGASFALSMLGRAAMGDTWDDISDWEKENNWILPLGTSGDYIKIPIGPGLKLFHFAGNLLEQSIFSKDKVSIIELASHIALSTIDNFNVFGSGGSLGQLVSPTVLRPAIQILENKKFTGAKMYQDAVSPFTGYAAPAYTKAFGSTPRHWVAVSKFLNWASGGDNIKPGSLNVPAEAIAHAMKSYLMPGTVNEIDRALTAVENIVGKGTFGPQSVPLLNRVYGHTDEGQNYARLVKQMQDWNQKVEEVRSYNKEASGEGSTMSKKGQEHLSALNENKGVAFNMFKNFRKFKKLVIDINKVIRLANDEGDKEMTQKLYKVRLDLFDTFEKTGKLRTIAFPERYSKLLTKR